MCKWLTLLIGLSLGAVAWGTPNAEGEAHFRFGPFFEWRSEDALGMTRFAIRPFYAWEQSTLNPADEDMEIAWPLTHFSWRGDARQWRLIWSFWWERDRTERTSRDYSFAIPPLWVNGRMDETDNYWGLFPIWGRMPRVFLLEDFQWRLFPLWMRYRTGGTQGVYRDYFLWPFFSLKYDADRTRWALWPLYGTKRERGVDSRFVLWPFWNDRTFTAPNHRGSAWMLWPLWESVDADTEWGGGFLSPFFQWRHTSDGAFLLRCPWPLFERYSDPRESTWKSWRFWGMTTRGSRAGWWFLHPIMVSERQHTVNRYTFHRRFWPFYVEEETHGYDAQGNSRLESSHFRIWPLFASDYTEQEGLRRRSLILFPIRDVPAIERNWSPFWTFYTATQKPGEKEVLHELFWGLIWWHTEAEPPESSAPPPPPEAEKPMPLLAPLARGSSPRKHEGTQGPGHFTVRPCGLTTVPIPCVSVDFLGSGPSVARKGAPASPEKADWPFGSVAAWKFGSYGGASPHTLISLLQGAKRRAAVAVSGEAAERPMEPEAVRATPCVFAVLKAHGQDWAGVHTQVGGFDDSLA